MEDARTATILVVDDEEPLAEMVSGALRFAGYSVRVASDGVSALNVVKSDPPDLIVLDVNMPQMDGFDVCRRLRRDGVQIPVIFLTARDDIADKRTGFRHGGDDYVTKPFSLEELGLRIEALLRRTVDEEQPGSRIEVGDISIDEAAHRVRVREREVHLSPTEFLLLRFLALNAGRVMSKPQIVEYVWEYDFDGNFGIVETYISYLRKKLEGSEAASIETVRGFGYVIRAER